MMNRIGVILLATGAGVLVGWGLYWFFRLAFLRLPLPLKIGIAAIAIGLIIILASLIRERRRASREDKEKFKGVQE
jgi:ABC-type antimicrobial peptide transport system permease subunit